MAFAAIVERVVCCDGCLPPLAMKNNQLPTGSHILQIGVECLGVVAETSETIFG